MTNARGSEVVAGVAEALWQQRLSRDAYLRLRTGEPIEHLDTGSLEEAKEDAAFAARQLETLSAVDTTSLPESDRVTRAFLDAYLRDLADGPAMWWWSFPVTPYSTSLLGVIAPQVLGSFSFSDRSDVDRYLAVAADYAESAGVVREKLAAMAERGWLVPRPALPGVLATLNGLREGAKRVIPVTAERRASLKTADATRLESRLDALLHDEILPAYDRLLGAVDDLTERAPDEVGISQYPGGADAYARMVRYHATFDIEPQRIHETGLSEVERLTEDMAEVRAALGVAGSEREFRAHLESEGRMFARSPEDVERKYRDAIARIEDLLPQSFATMPEAPYDIERLDPSYEAGMTYGYYEPPTSVKPVGKYRYNGSGLDTRSQLNAAALIYHELVPGHHFHLARQFENKDVPAVQRELAFFGAFVEGWAEYAAGLADEIGMYADPYDKYGWLIHQRFVAQRLVVDSGMNALGWPLEKARAFMRANTLESDTQVATETLRYSTDMPAQALGYRLGFLKLREIRAQAQQARGAGFDIREFHELVLGPGAMPLFVVEDNIRRAVASGTDPRPL